MDSMFKQYYFRAKNKAYGIVFTAFSIVFSSSKCICCGKNTCGLPLCKTCIDSFILNFEPSGSRRCCCCGRILKSNDTLCVICRREHGFSHINSVFPLYPYRLWRKELLFDWKMKGQRALSPLFASAVDKALSMLYANRKKSDICLVPVPPRPGKIRRYGWDQVDELVLLLHNLYGYQEKKLLVRFTVEQQKKKNYIERHNNKNAFGISGTFAEMKKCGIMLSEVVLIDDVITTGSTVDECADILKRGGIGKVNVLSLFIVD